MHNCAGRVLRNKRTTDATDKIILWHDVGQLRTDNDSAFPLVDEQLPGLSWL